VSRVIEKNRRRVSGRERTAFVVAGVGLGVFSVLFALVRSKRSAATDLAITMKFQQRRHPVLRLVMSVVSWPGFPPQSRTIPPLIATAIALAGHPLEGIFQFLAWGTGGISFTFKRIMRRERPQPPQVRVALARIGGSSFPSGHVLNYMGVYGFLTYLAWTYLRPGRIRKAVVGGLLSLLALVGPSRIYLGHHWFTDVLASYLLGFAYLVGITAIYRRVKRLAGRM
jgi:membrane-associated phospholipid phosphatase